MTEPNVTVTLRLPLKWGGCRYVTLDCGTPLEKSAPVVKNTGAPLAQKKCASAICDPTYGGGKSSGAKRAPLLFASGAEQATFPPTVGAAGSHWPSGADKGSLEDELRRTRETLTDVAAELAGLDQTLWPVWARERSVKAKIADTHGGVLFNRAGRQDRVPLFAALDQIAAEWGGTKKERTQVAIHVRSLERQVRNLSRDVERQKRRAKHGANEKA